MFDLHNLATVPLGFLIKGLPISLLKERVAGFDLLNREIYFKSLKSLEFDYLVLALGSETNFYNIPGLAAHALTFKTFADAIRIRDAIWTLAHERVPLIRIVIGGGGSAGVELAGELKAWCGELEKEVKQCRLSVAVIERSPTILTGFAPKIVNLAHRRLARLGVTILENREVRSLTAREVFLDKDEKIPYDTFIWNGGTKAASVIENLSLKREPRGRLEVEPTMNCLPQTPELQLENRVYALGDIVSFLNPQTQRPVPGVARAALTEAKVAAVNIFADIMAAENSKSAANKISYQPREYPYIIPIGGKYAIAKIGPFILSGFIAWVAKELVELFYLLSVMRPLPALATWFHGLKIFAENDRLG